MFILYTIFAYSGEKQNVQFFRENIEQNGSCFFIIGQYETTQIVVHSNSMLKFNLKTSNTEIMQYNDIILYETEKANLQH